MNRLTYFVILSAIFISACTGFQKIDSNSVKTVTLSDFEQNSDLDVLEMQKNGIIIKVPKGTTIPVEVSLSFPAIAFNPGKNSVTFQEDIYFYISQKELLISKDRNKWASPGNTGALKKMFNYKQGSVSFGFHASKGVKPRIHFLLQTK